jgi:uncharacterized protein YjbI with pentapeptide repeats
MNGADPNEDHLIPTNLTGAHLQDTDLRGAYLKGATGITREDLEHQVSSLEGTIMPDGSKHD